MFDDMLHQGELYVTNVSNVNNGACTDPDGKMLRTIGNHSIYNGGYEFTDGTAIYGNEKINNGGMASYPEINYLFFNSARCEVWGFDMATLKPKMFCKSPFLMGFFAGEKGCYCRTNNGDYFDLASGKQLMIPHKYPFGGEPLDACVDNDGNLIFVFNDNGGNGVAGLSLVKNGNTKISFIPFADLQYVHLYDDHALSYTLRKSEKKNSYSENNTKIHFRKTPPKRYDIDKKKYVKGFYVFKVDWASKVDGEGVHSSQTLSLIDKLDNFDDVEKYKGGIFETGNHVFTQTITHAVANETDYLVDRYGGTQVYHEEKTERTTYSYHTQNSKGGGAIYDETLDDIYGDYDCDVAGIFALDNDDKPYMDSKGFHHSFSYVVIVKKISSPYKIYSVPPDNEPDAIVYSRDYDVYQERGHSIDGKPIVVCVNGGYSVFGHSFPYGKIGLDFIEAKKGKFLCLQGNGYIYDAKTDKFELIPEKYKDVYMTYDINYRLRKTNRALLQKIKRNLLLMLKAQV